MGNEEVSEQGKCDIRAPDSAVDQRVEVQRGSAKGKYEGEVRRGSAKGKCEGEVRSASAKGKCEGEVRRGNAKEEKRETKTSPTTARLSYPKGRLNMQPRCT